jgi:hypothetical protein
MKYIYVNQLLYIARAASGNSNVTYVDKDGVLRWYDAVRYGKLLSEEDAREVAPEYFL